MGINSLANGILLFQRYELRSQFCELRSFLSPRFYTTLFNRQIVILYCPFQGYQHPESVNVEQTIARLFWNLAIGNSGFVVPTIFILRICLQYFRIFRFNGFHHWFSLRSDKHYGEHAHVYDTDEIWGVPNEVATFGKIFDRNRKRLLHR